MILDMSKIVYVNPNLRVIGVEAAELERAMESLGHDYTEDGLVVEWPHKIVEADSSSMLLLAWQLKGV